MRTIKNWLVDYGSILFTGGGFLLGGRLRLCDNPDLVAFGDEFSDVVSVAVEGGDRGRHEHAVAVAKDVKDLRHDLGVIAEKAIPIKTGISSILR